MKLRTVTLIGGVLCGLLAVGIVIAQGDFDLTWFQIGASGQRVEGGGLALDSSIGQSVSESVEGGGLELQSGFLVGLEMTTPTPTNTPTITPTVTPTITPGGPTFTPTMTATPTNTPTLTPTPKPVPDLYLPILYKDT